MASDLIAQLQADIAGRDACIDLLNRDLELKESCIAALMATVSELQRAFTQLAREGDVTDPVLRQTLTSMRVQGPVQ